MGGGGWGGVGGLVVCTVIFMSNPTVVLCCVEVGVLTIQIDSKNYIEESLYVWIVKKAPVFKKFSCTSHVCFTLLFCKQMSLLGCYADFL